MITTEVQVKRRELKYYINYSDYEYLKDVLSKLMTRDPYCIETGGYFIRSLYFDSLNDDSIQEKLAGEENRSKYRIRIYYFDQDWAKFERKNKFNDYVLKDTGIITKDQALNFIKGDHDVLLQQNSKVLNSIYMDFKRTYMTPAVIVDYIRDVYLMDFNQIRITFDKKLRRNRQNFDLYSPEISTEPIQRDDIIILEVKYNDFLPPWFKSLIETRGQVRSAISKYCMSRINGDNYWVQ